MNTEMSYDTSQKCFLMLYVSSYSIYSNKLIDKNVLAGSLLLFHCEVSVLIYCLCLSSVGSYWVYSVYPPSYTPGNIRYCQKTTFMFAFVLTTLVWVMMALSFCCGGCYVIFACCCGTFSARHRLSPLRNTFYGGTDSAPGGEAGDVWFESWFMTSNVVGVDLFQRLWQEWHFMM